MCSVFAEYEDGSVSTVAVEYIKSVQFEISEKFITEVYESCSGVIMPATGGTVMDLSCLPYDSTTCTPKRWYQYMGNAEENIYVPFLIDYTYDNPERAFTAETKRCNESYEVK